MRKKVLSCFIFVLFFIIIFFFYKCPIKLIFGVDCPGCGMTRAYKALLKLDIKSAFAYHELFPIPFIFVTYLLFKKRIGIGEKKELIFLSIFYLMFIIRWIIKLF
ncbi:MAG: DUF2752 domain-containing protein [Clostridia bacterium]|nr:DUF2752 domain-containing protein [Clostridia bacterium]